MGAGDFYVRKILHITDVHFGRGHQPDRAAAVRDLAHRRRPDLVVFSGDLTKRAKPRQFRAARKFVDDLGAPAVVVPGNHDVPLFRFWERIFSPYGAYRRHFHPELEPVWTDEELLVIGVNTAHGWTFTGGRVKRRRIREIEALLRENAGERFAIVVLHHPMIPVPGYGSEKVFRNARHVARALSSGGADLVLSGHVHLSHLGSSASIHPSGGSGVPILFSGTASCSRGRGEELAGNSCHWLEIDGQDFAIERLVWESDEAEFAPKEKVSLSRESVS